MNRPDVMFQAHTTPDYTFDVMTTSPAPIFVLFREGESQPVTGQLNAVDVIPGDANYNDLWQVARVTVPASSSQTHNVLATLPGQVG